MIEQRAGAPWLVYVLGALCTGAVAAAYLAVGPPAQSAAVTRTAVVQRGVVQSTVSASGNLTAASQTTVDFKVSGQLAQVYTQVGERVLEGKLLAELNPDQAQTAVTVAEDNLRSAEDRLQQADSESAAPAQTTTTQKTTTQKKTKTTKKTQEGEETEAGGSSPSSPSTASSAVARAAAVASDEAQVESARASLQSAEQSLAQTRLYAPSNGTVASIAAETPGDSVSAGSGASSSSSAATGGSSSAGNSGSGAGAGAGGSASTGTGSAGAGSSGGSGSGSSSSSGFIVLVDTSSMQLVVPLSESDITKVKVGQVATVTVNALPTEKLAARVTSIALLSTTSSGVVSYDVTLQLEQLASGLRPGMTASAEIVTAQAENALNVTSSAISGRSAAATLTVVRDGKHVRQPVIVGLVGNSTTQILSGVNAGEEVVVPVVAAGGLSSGTTGRPGGLGGGLGGGGLGGGGGGGGGGAVRFFGGGGVGG